MRRATTDSTAEVLRRNKARLSVSMVHAAPSAAAGALRKLLVPRTALVPALAASAAPASALETADANQMPPCSPLASADRVFCPAPFVATLDDRVDKMSVMIETELAPPGAVGAAALLDLCIGLQSGPFKEEDDLREQLRQRCRRHWVLL